jgi:hypothetical protein
MLLMSQLLLIVEGQASWASSGGQCRCAGATPEELASLGQEESWCSQMCHVNGLILSGAQLYSSVDLRLTAVLASGLICVEPCRQHAWLKQ